MAIISNKTLCTICARGGSKGVKNKNIRMINNKPLIAHTIDIALESDLFEDVVVSTDCDQIAETSLKYGAQILFKRPEDLSSDKAAKLPVIRHAFTESEKLLRKRYDFLFDLDATSPLRVLKDLFECSTMIKSGNYTNIITASPSRRSPYFNLVELNDDGRPFLSKAFNVSRRQDSPKCFDMNASIYVWTRDAILKEDSLFLSATKLYVMPENRSMDIDTELDFSIVKALMEGVV